MALSPLAGKAKHGASDQKARARQKAVFPPRRESEGRPLLALRAAAFVALARPKAVWAGRLFRMTRHPSPAPSPRILPAQSRGGSAQAWLVVPNTGQIILVK